MWPWRRRRALPRVRARTTRSNVPESTSSPIPSGLTCSEHEANAADRVNESLNTFDVDFLSEPCDLHVDHVVDRRGSAWLLPDFLREHLPRHDMTEMPEQVLEQLEFARGEVNGFALSRRTPGDEVELQIGDLEAKLLRCAASAKQGANTGEKLRQGKRLDQIVIGSEIEPKHPVFHTIA